MRHSAAIIGGGIAGLSAGIALRKAGYEVTLFEQAAAIRPMGAALSIWGNAMAGLDWLGCGDPVRRRASRIEALALTDTRGRALFGPADVSASDSWLPLRSDLQATMLETLGAGYVRLGIQVGDVRLDDDSVSITGAGDAMLGTYDLAVVADGIHSATATRLLGNPPTFRGYGGVLCLADAAPQTGGIGEEIWGNGDRFGLFDAGGLAYWFYMASGTQGEVAALDHDAIAQRASAYPDRIRAAVAASDPASLIHVPIFSRPFPRIFGQGRVICIGDAAHAMEPNQGQGACQGIEDAWALGVLASRLPPEEILPEFDRARRKRVGRAHRDSALIGRVAHGEGLVRSTISTLFRAMPRQLDERQIRQRIAPPVYR